jgi:methionyl-tRNA formyltransferase
MLNSVKLNADLNSVIIFIGGGMLMINAMKLARSMGFEVRAIVAPRHYSEIISSGNKLSDELSINNIKFDVINDEHSLIELPWIEDKNKDYLGLCFGPAWIFSNKTLSIFNENIFNFNGIPLPQYLGGAHYTWQILNKDKRMGCYIQQINEKVDFGDIYLSRTGKIESETFSPMDYFNANEAYGLSFIKIFFEMVRDKLSFETTKYLSIYDEHLYFPRLNTRDQGWIDWYWSADNICDFCNAFDEPYIGAGTMFGNIEVRFSRVSISERIKFHPFCNGMIVRILDGNFYIASDGGLLKVTSIKQECEKPILLKRGDRFHTPMNLLEKSRTFRPTY